MIQCIDCEYCIKDELGRIHLKCNPFENVKEPECIQKWLLMKLDVMVRSYQATLGFYQKLAPLQEKMLKHLERELDEMEEADKWKYLDEESEETEFNKDQENKDDDLGTLY